MTKTLLLLLLVFQSCNFHSGKEYQIDLAAKQIGGINFADKPSQIRSQLKDTAFREIPRDVMSDQGQRVNDTIWVISISGHEFTRFSHPTQVFIQDSIFKTSEGVGVGSTVQEFVDRYGIPDLVEEDIGYSLNFKVFNLLVSVYVWPPCECENTFASMDKQCRIANMHIVVPA